MDVETLSEVGKGNAVGENIQFCPFYATREIQNECHVILLPYNYLFDESTRKVLNLNLKNSIIIIDEGHNIESVAEDAVSFKLRDADLNLFLESIKATLTILDKVKDDDNKNNLSVDQLFMLNRSINSLVTWLSNEKLAISDKLKIKEKHKTYTGTNIFDIFANNNINITKDNFEDFTTVLSSMVEMLNKYMNDFKLSQLDQKNVNRYISAIDIIRKCFGILFSDIVKNCIEYFQLYINEEAIAYSDCDDVNKVYDNMKKYGKNKTKIVYDKYETTKCKNISLLCFSATASLLGILKEKTNSIVVTSGTLSPIEPFSKQLGGKYFSFQHVLENDHVIKSHQLFVGCMTHYNKQILLSTYENRSNENYMRALGDCIYDIIIYIPHGVLIFFASYGSMYETVNIWKKLKIYDKINAYKTIFVEPNKASELKDILNQYENIIKKKKKGAILMGVCRGKISEGIDFKDECCRGVIICGLPYGNVYDSKIIFKKVFLDNFKHEVNDPTENSSNVSRGTSWYNEEAMRAINQSIGRVIRHRNDYGAVFFLDSRFANKNRIQEISKWVRTHFRVYRDIDQIQGDIEKFFELFKGMNTAQNVNNNMNNTGANSNNANNAKTIEYDENSEMGKIGKNFQDCFIKNVKNNNTTNSNSLNSKKYVFNPIKKTQNQPKILSMIQNITQGKNQEKTIYVDENNEKSIFKNQQEEEKSDNIKIDHAKMLMDAFKEVLSEQMFTKFFELIKQTKKKNEENKYETFIAEVIDLIVQNFEKPEEKEMEESREGIVGVTQDKTDNVGQEENKKRKRNICFNDIMNTNQLTNIWEMLIKLINNFFPKEEREKCFFILKNRFKNNTNGFDELEKYVYNYKLEQIEII
uniref:Helicase ATP-binding domain-containing protein n=1 Tax=Piliocolobus tephrosceles TaxID=591936 RepID=A0A8C9GL52_9PRIM